MPSHERPPASVSVALLLTHGRSNRLFLTHHKSEAGRNPQLGLIAGGVELSDPDPVAAGMREALEEAHLDPSNIIFVKGRNNPHPHVAMINTGEKIKVGLIFDMTYSGPRVPLEGWGITDDEKVDGILLYSWAQVMGLLLQKEDIYQPDFNTPQLLRWLLLNHGGTGSRTSAVQSWLSENQSAFPGLRRRPSSQDQTDLSEHWEYVPPYETWILTPGLFGLAQKTNFARQRSKWQNTK